MERRGNGWIISRAGLVGLAILGFVSSAAWATELASSTQASGGLVSSANRKAQIVLGEAVIGTSAGPTTTLTLGWLPSTGISLVTPPVSLLSIQVTPTSWTLPDVAANSAQLTGEAERLRITNTGTISATLSLHLLPPSGWVVGASPGVEQVALSALITGPIDRPEASHFNTEGTTEDHVGLTSKRATSTVFAFPGSRATGERIPPTENRAISLLLRTPTRTTRTDTQEMHLVITAELP